LAEREQPSGGKGDRSSAVEIDQSGSHWDDLADYECIGRTISGRLYTFRFGGRNVGGGPFSCVGSCRIGET
jgi:hypothetical protein